MFSKARLVTGPFTYCLLNNYNTPTRALRAEKTVQGWMITIEELLKCANYYLGSILGASRKSASPCNPLKSILLPPCPPPQWARIPKLRSEYKISKCILTEILSLAKNDIDRDISFDKNYIDRDTLPGLKLY